MLHLLLGLALLAGSGATRVDASPPGAANRRASRTEYDAGVRAFNKGDYDAAIQHFGKGYQIDPNPTFLLLTAQSWQKKADCPKAIEGYQRWLDAAPKSAQRKQVQDTIEQLEKYQDDPFSEGGVNPCVATTPEPSPSPTST